MTRAGRLHLWVSDDIWWWAPEVFALLGLAAGPPSTMLLLDALDDADRPAVAALLAAPPRGPFSLLVRTRAAEPAGRWLVLTGDPIRDRAGGVREIVGYLVDVTSRQRAALGGCADEAVAAAGASRATIEQAKGALMLAYGLDEHGAFRQLVWQSKQANVKLRDLAERLLASIAAENPTSPETRARLDELLYAAPGRGTRHGPPAQPELRLHTHRRDGAVVVVAEGELDLATAEAFDAGLAAVLRVGGGADTAVLDLRGVTHLGSVAATLIARHERRQARLSRRLLVVARRGGQVARVLEVALPHVKLYQEASAALDAAPGAG